MPFDLGKDLIRITRIRLPCIEFGQALLGFGNVYGTTRFEVTNTTQYYLYAAVLDGSISYDAAPGGGTLGAGLGDGLGDGLGAGAPSGDGGAATTWIVR